MPPALHVRDLSCVKKRTRGYTFFLCTQHSRWLAGERPGPSLIAATVSGRQGRHCEVRSGRCAEPKANLRAKAHELHVRLLQPGELARDNKAQCIQRLDGL